MRNFSVNLFKEYRRCKNRIRNHFTRQNARNKQQNAFVNNVWFTHFSSFVCNWTWWVYNEHNFIRTYKHILLRFALGITERIWLLLFANCTSMLYLFLPLFIFSLFLYLKCECSSFSVVKGFFCSLHQCVILNLVKRYEMKNI